MCFKLQLVIWFPNLLVLQKNMKVPVILEVWVICKSLQENLGKVLLFNSFVIQYTMIRLLSRTSCWATVFLKVAKYSASNSCKMCCIKCFC